MSLKLDFAVKMRFMFVTYGTYRISKSFQLYPGPLPPGILPGGANGADLFSFNRWGVTLNLKIERD